MNRKRRKRLFFFILKFSTSCELGGGDTGRGKRRAGITAGPGGSRLENGGAGVGPDTGMVSFGDVQQSEVNGFSDKLRIPLPGLTLFSVRGWDGGRKKTRCSQRCRPCKVKSGRDSLRLGGQG